MTDTPKELSAERLAKIRAFDIGDLATWVAQDEGDLVVELLAHIDALTARIAELTKPVDDAEVKSRITSLTDACYCDGHAECEFCGTSKLITRLARENAALKHDIDRHLTITTHQAEEIIAAEAKLAEAVAARDMQIACPDYEVDRILKTRDWMDMTRAALLALATPEAITDAAVEAFRKASMVFWEKRNAEALKALQVGNKPSLDVHEAAWQSDCAGVAAALRVMAEG